MSYKHMVLLLTNQSCNETVYCGSLHWPYGLSFRPSVFQVQREKGEHCSGSPVVCDEPWQSQKYCMLEIQEYAVGVSGQIYTRSCMPTDRKCNPGETVDVSSRIDDRYHFKTYYRCCEGDLCNASELMSSSNKLTSINVLFTSILLSFVAGWMFN